ncbi:MAG: N-acetylglucosamine-6-phosphate deacetylase [Nitrospirota bacterium]
MNIIDIHTHGIGGYDTRTTDIEHILRIAELQGAEGVMAIIPTLYPAPIKVMRESMLLVKKAMERQKDLSNPLSPSFSKGGLSEAIDPARIADRASRIIGVHLEGPFLNPSKCGALNAMTFLEPMEHHLEELIDGFEDVVKIITLAPELEGATHLIKKLTDRGIIVSMGHSEATYAQAEEGFNAGAKGITHLFNAMSGFHHREPGLAGFGLMNRDVYIEVIADPYHLHPKTLEYILRTKHPERIIIVSDAVKETHTPSAREGVVDRHGTLLGGAMTIPEALRKLTQTGFDGDALLRCVSENPLRYLNVSSRATYDV